MLIVHAWESLNETFEARASEWILAFATLTMALVSYVNEDMFNTPALEKLALWLAQDTWTLVFLVIGLTRLIVLCINGMYWRTPLYRCILAFVTSGLLFQISWGVADNLSFGVAIFPWLFVLDTYNALRAGKEAGIAQYLHYQRKAVKSVRTANPTPHR
jgi:hypothetical protein